MYRLWPLVFLPLAALAVPDGSTWSGFMGDCHDISLVVKTDDTYSVPTLLATCKRRSDGERKSELPLDRCLAYSPSKGLYGRSMGRAFEHYYCYDCVVPGPEPGVMACECGTGDAPLIPHVVNLNQIIGTYDGSLACFGKKALPIEKEFRWSGHDQKNNSSTFAR